MLSACSALLCCRMYTRKNEAFFYSLTSTFCYAWKLLNSLQLSPFWNSSLLYVFYCYFAFVSKLCGTVCRLSRWSSGSAMSMVWRWQISVGCHAHDSGQDIWRVLTPCPSLWLLSLISGGDRMKTKGASHGETSQLCRTLTRAAVLLWSMWPCPFPWHW